MISNLVAKCVTNQSINRSQEFRNAGFVVVETEEQEWLTADRHKQGHMHWTEEEIHVENICGQEHEDKEEEDDEEMADEPAIHFHCDAVTFLAASTNRRWSNVFPTPTSFTANKPWSKCLKQMCINCVDSNWINSNDVIDKLLLMVIHSWMIEV